MSTKINDLAECALFAVMQTGNVTAVTSATVVTTGSTKDFVTADGPVTLLVTTGTIAGTSQTTSISVQESTDGTTWTGVVASPIAGGAFPLTTGTSTNAATAVTFLRAKRWLQTIQTTSGTSAVIPVGVTLIEQKKTL